MKNQIEKLKNRLLIVEKVYDRFKHLDHLLSDKTWIDGDDPSPLRSCTYDLWQAIRTASKEDT